MYLSMTLILIILITLVIIFFRSVKGVIYLIGTAEVFFQLMHYFADNIGVAEISSLVSRYIPNSIFSIIDYYADGIVYTILAWLLFIIFFWFFIYLVKYLFNRK